MLPCAASRVARALRLLSPCAGYLAHGTATDYMHDRLSVPLAFTWEIFGDAAAHFNDCFRMFNPVSAQHLEEVGALCQLLPQHGLSGCPVAVPAA